MYIWAYAEIHMYIHVDICIYVYIYVDGIVSNIMFKCIYTCNTLLSKVYLINNG